MIHRKKVILFGTSRLHRPFAKILNKELVINSHPSYQISFPKIGYFHSAAEISQAINFLKNPESIPRSLWQYVFRIEPRVTTPLNEFDTNLEGSIRLNKSFTPNFYFGDIETVIMEISSLTVNIHTESGSILHTNPNINRNIPYNKIYPDGYYKIFEPNLPTKKIETYLANLVKQLCEIKSQKPVKNVIVLSHLRSTKYANTLREKIHLMVAEACAVASCIYVDTAEILDSYGFAENSGIIDPHHLSNGGENALAQLLFNTLNSLETS